MVLVPQAGPSHLLKVESKHIAREADVIHRSSTPGLGCVTKRHDGEACIGNRKLEQETTEGTHARETPAYRCRLKAWHEPHQTSPNQGAIHASNHTRITAPCAIKAPDKEEPARHPPLQDKHTFQGAPAHHNGLHLLHKALLHLL